jgi:hypothetical protein
VTLTVGTAIVGTSVGALHTVMRAEQTGRTRVATRGILARLAKQFRDDVDATVQETTNADHTEWRFHLADDHFVQYRLATGEIEWSEHSASHVVRRESFRLPDGWTATITLPSDTMSAVALLTIIPERGPRYEGCEMRVNAVLGKDRRYSKSSIGGDPHGSP